MGKTTAIFILSLATTIRGFTDNRQRSFKEGFLFGTASSAYQVEGGWDADGKGPSVWDHYFHSHPEKYPIVQGDIASNSYYNYKRDVQMLKELGVDFYRFSISWPRILPTGFSNNQNEPGLQYYDNLIDELLKHNIQPMVTLYHFDMPQALQDLGGWTNPHSIDWFQRYARVIFKRYSSKVKYWITVNQPNSVCIDEYNESPVSIEGTKGIAEYLCVKNVMLAHAKVYRLYEKEYKKKHGGSVGISLSVNWADPLTNSTENVEATKQFREFSFGIFVHPIWSKNGGFPQRVKDRVAKRSKEQGYATSRLPALTQEEIKLIKGSADFLGLNYYTTFLVSPSSGGFPSPSYSDDVSAELTSRDTWEQSRSPWLKSAPYGLYKACIHLNQVYDYPQIYITENGWSSDAGVEDPRRSEHLQQHLKALLLAIEDGTEVRGYTYWSLMDNVEWKAETDERFGLYEVDFESADRTRTARQSALVYRRILQTRIVEEGWRPKSLRGGGKKEEL